MAMTKDEALGALVAYVENFSKAFPALRGDGVRLANQYCNAQLQKRIEKLLEVSFGFMDASDLVAVLDCIHDEAKKQDGDRRPGRPRKPRDSAPAGDSPVQPDVATSPQE